MAKSSSEGLEELRLASKIAEPREKHGLSRAERAARMRTSGPLISRLERGGGCTLRTLQRVADASDAVLEIEFIPKEDLRQSGKAA